MNRVEYVDIFTQQGECQLSIGNFRVPGCVAIRWVGHLRGGVYTEYILSSTQSEVEKVVGTYSLGSVLILAWKHSRLHFRYMYFIEEFNEASIFRHGYM